MLFAKETILPLSVTKAEPFHILAVSNVPKGGFKERFNFWSVTPVLLSQVQDKATCGPEPVCEYVAVKSWYKGTLVLVASVVSSAAVPTESFSNIFLTQPLSVLTYS